uniref:Uncharacterized protein n=1 Tax=Solanum lycopersicum TaxID=4081 RepID=A0A3Q7JC15_SOLLC
MVTQTAYKTAFDESTMIHRQQQLSQETSEMSSKFPIIHSSMAQQLPSQHAQRTGQQRNNNCTKSSN